MRYTMKKGSVVLFLIFSLVLPQPSYADFNVTEVTDVDITGATIASAVIAGFTSIGAIISGLISSIRDRHKKVAPPSPPLPTTTTIALYAVNNDGTLASDPIPDDQDIVLPTTPEDNIQTYAYKNTGSVAWSPSNVSWYTTFDGPTGTEPFSEHYVALQKNNCNTVGSVAPGSFCTFELHTNIQHPGDWGIIQATGNLVGGTQLKNVLAGGGLEIAINVNPADYHLGYRSIKVENTLPPETGTGGIWIKSISSSGTLLSPTVTQCLPGPGSDLNCAYQTTCQTSSTQGINLARGVSCLIWYKAETKDSLNNDLALQTTPGTIDVIVDAQKQIQGGSWVDIPTYEEKSFFTATYNKSLYVGGIFTTAGGVAANSVAKWDGTNWSALEAVGIDGGAFSFTSMNGDLYVGGYFRYAGGTLVKGIAKWNGTNWSPLGPGLTNPLDGGIVFALANIGNMLYAGGIFDYSFSNPINYIAKWNGTEWSAVGTNNLSGEVKCLTSIGNDLYAGGSFSILDVPNTTFIAKWNGIDWSSVSTGFIDNSINALTSINGILYVGGGFGNAGGISVNGITNLENSIWQPLGAGVDRYVNALTSIGNKLYVGGDFTTAGDISAKGIAEWDTDTSSWSPQSRFGVGIEAGGWVSSLFSLGQDLYVGGNFGNAGGAANTRFIAKWNADTSAWSSLGTGMDGEILALITSPSLAVTGYALP